VLKRVKSNNDNDNQTGASTNSPEVTFCLRCVLNAVQIHSKIGRTERKRKKNNSDNSEDQNGFVLAIGNDS
jgi:hypothetical protein